MPDPSHRKVHDEIKSILLGLSERERTLLSAVIRIERDNLHIPQPHIPKPRLRSELLNKVREVIK